VYTQCPQCQTLYRVTAELLRAARGQVQCGRCAEVFDALTFLVEDDIIEGHAAESKSPPAQGPFTPDAFRPEEIPDHALEFSLPPDAVDKVFVEAPKVAMPAFGAVAVLTDAAEVHVIDEEFELDEDIDIPLTVDDPSNDPVALETEPDSFDEPPEGEAEQGWDIDEIPEGSDEAAEDEEEEARPTHIIEADEATVIDLVDAGDPANDDRVPPELRRRSVAMAEDGVEDEVVEFGDTAVLRERAFHYAWRAGAAVLGFLLLAQVIHHDRHDLVRRPTIGPLLQRVYGVLGGELSPEWNLKAYQVRQWGAAAAPGTEGTLRVRASVVNTADHAQPLPLLRLSLADLGGSRVGVRDFEPSEYLPDASSGDRMLAAGRRIDAEVVIVDPGKDAVGFEIDVCLRDDEHRVSCANDATPAS
jgi:predicted Zn finger-like uncharacterized protein